MPSKRAGVAIVQELQRASRQGSAVESGALQRIWYEHDHSKKMFHSTMKAMLESSLVLFEQWDGYCFYRWHGVDTKLIQRRIP